jgi:hypothetical protein
MGGIGGAITGAFVSRQNPGGEPDNITDALEEIGYQLKQLGNAGAATPMGAIEAHSLAVRESLEIVANAISEGSSELADAIRYAADTVAGKEE